MFGLVGPNMHIHAPAILLHCSAVVDRHSTDQLLYLESPSFPTQRAGRPSTLSQSVNLALLVSYLPLRRQTCPIGAIGGVYSQTDRGV